MSYFATRTLQSRSIWTSPNGSANLKCTPSRRMPTRISLKCLFFQMSRWLENLLEPPRRLMAVDGIATTHTSAIQHRFSVFHATVAPEIYGDTMFANMYTAYEALPETMKARIEGLNWRSDRMKTQRSLYPDKVFSDAELANIHDVAHPIVRTHPVSGRKALYLAMRRASLTKIEGLSEVEGIGLVEELRDFATASRFVYSHHWKAGDVMAWDNRGSIHRATPWDERIYKRHAHRVTVMGDVPF